MLCPLSALNPGGGPEHLINNEDLEGLAAEMATEILSYGLVLFELQDVTSIVEDALRLTLPPPEYPEIYDLALKLPDGISDWEHFYPIGIGYFDSEDYMPAQIRGRYRSGLEVQVGTLEEWSNYGHFHRIIFKDENGGELSEDMYVSCSSDRGWNFCVMCGCLEYLRVWLDPTLPPRIAFKDSAPTMSLEGELYEILSSRHEERDHAGLFPSFEYGEISKTFEGDHYQYRFFMARKDSRHTAHAISLGLRGEKLLPSLYADFRCWESMRPDLWPSPTFESVRTNIFAQFSCWSKSFDDNPFQSLPVEIFLEILSQLSIPAVLALSSTSRSLRQLITGPAFLNQVVKTAVLTGTEFWILPVAGLPREKERALETASAWIRAASTASSRSSALSSRENPGVSAAETIHELGLPFLSPQFPFVSFLRACYASDSMRNRQRLWRVVKQFDVLWRDYRLNGWQKDDVFTAHWVNS